MKRFSILSALALLACCFLSAPASMRACGWAGTTNYYLFHVFHGDRTSTAVTQKRLAAWWTQYVGRTITTEDLDGLTDMDPETFTTSDNPILKAVRRKNDPEMKEYVRLLCQYLGVAPSGFDPWYYPDEEALRAQQDDYQEVCRQAKRHFTGWMAPQYILLYMRASFQQSSWQDVVDAWKKHMQQQPASVFRDMAEGFYAGALRKQGRDEDASEIYARIGDLHSATWCLRDGRNLGSLRRLYEKDPNGNALRLMLQDFVNNAQETIDNGGDSSIDAGRYWSCVYKEEVEEFSRFAEEVSRGGRTQEPCMWLMAAAWINYLNGNAAKALEQIDRAMSLKGSAEVKDNARVIRLAISTAGVSNFEAYERFLLPELKWLRGKLMSEGQDENFFYRATERIYMQHLIPLYTSAGRPFEAALLRGALEHQSVQAGGYEITEVSYSSAYVNDLWQQSSEDLENIYRQIFHAQRSALQDWLYTQLPQPMQQETFYADLIGTRAISEGLFSRAVKWQSRVPASFVSGQPISYYMARRDYKRERWIGKRQRTAEVGGWDMETPTPVSANQKLTFAREAVSLTETCNSNIDARARAEAYYRLATIIYQASPQGDCWYLSHYGVSCVEEASLLDSLAYRMLCNAEQILGMRDKALRTRILYAKSFINLDANIYNEDYGYYQFWEYTYSWEEQCFHLQFHPDDAHQQSRDYAALTRWLKEYPGQASADYITHCDVLQIWMRR